MDDGNSGNSDATNGPRSAQDQLIQAASTVWWPERAADVARYLADLAPEMLEDIARGMSLYDDPSVDLVTRRLVVIAVLTTLGRNRELNAHLDGALGNGVPVSTIAAVLRHVARYAGTPAAVDGFIALRKAQERADNPDIPTAMRDGRGSSA
jgi:4-carboxymuconolactone decarboxylase